MGQPARLYRSLVLDVQINGALVTFSVGFAEPLTLEKLGGAIPTLTVEGNSISPVRVWQYKPLPMVDAATEERPTSDAKEE